MAAIIAGSRNGRRRALLAYVDDTTSRIMALHFTATESTFSYFAVSGTALASRQSVT